MNLILIYSIVELIKQCSALELKQTDYILIKLKVINKCLMVQAASDI